MNLEYHTNRPLDPADIIRVFRTSGITRPVQDAKRIETMFANSNLVISAWDQTRLVAISRALTDFSYCCYLSDLAVEAGYQRKGIGRELLRRTQAAIGEEVSLILLSAPSAMEFYPKFGFSLADSAYVIRRQR